MRFCFFGCTGSSLLHQLSLVEVHGLLIVVASLVAEQGSRVLGLRSCNTWALYSV